ncbi:hypothetical protein TNIN_350331 [Trichonephila inaurata madagascariensis]|uniref:Uncharacterized protein n=1 Tax=Trichonephila inaurata madagascariensis TaxID=2747483 RepID=A0A8X6YS56_9ARAC|nr:hypothetical protein TNIN_350331 [Trichonephila inaurata madagascariensis]
MPLAQTRFRQTGFTAPESPLGPGRRFRCFRNHATNLSENVKFSRMAPRFPDLFGKVTIFQVSGRSGIPLLPQYQEMVGRGVLVVVAKQYGWSGR